MTTLVKLKRKDNDKSKKWGGQILKDTPDYKVVDLQNNLKAVGVFTETVDGDFGGKTEKALKLFQWACAKLTACIKAKTRVIRTVSSTITVTGVLNQATYDELTLWVKNKQETTGDLVRIAFSTLANMEAGSGFKKIVSASVLVDEIVVSKGAVQLVRDMNSKAKDKKVAIKVNQALRVYGVKVTGAVVTPASKSQHLIGHAIDCNIVDGSNWNNSATFKNKKETQSAKDLIKALKTAGYRWGGDFGKVDTPHFDKQVLSTSFDYEAKFYFNQRMISLNQNIPKEII